MYTKTSLCQMRQGVEQDQASALVKFIVSSPTGERQQGSSWIKESQVHKENDRGTGKGGMG